MHQRYLLAVASGILLALAFPNASIAGLGWIAPGLMLMSGLGASRATAFRLGFAGGFAKSLVAFYWLLLIPFPAGAFVGWLALSMYLAVYTAVWMWFCWSLFPRGNGREELDAGGSKAVDAMAGTTILQRQVWALSCAVVWVALEMIVSRFLTGFPWGLLGVSQYEVLSVIQIASVTGVYGVSFLMVWFSVSVASAAVLLVRHPVQLRLCWGDLMVPLLVIAGVSAHGANRLLPLPKPDETLKVALVQPSIPQTLIWDPAENTNRFSQLLSLSEKALTERPDVLIWPEAAVPNLLRYDPATYTAVTNLVREHGVWMILGADDAVARISRAPEYQNRDESYEPEYDFYNSSFLIGPDGELEGVYRKRRLVIFGEYIPFVRWFPFLKRFIPAGDGFQAGDRPVPFELPGLEVTTSVLICFEDVFPHLAREYVSDETDFLLNLTNNGWFGESAAQWQHAANAVFRAVENRVPLVRCANNGLTCWVDPFGRMHDVYFDDSTDIYKAGYKIVRVPIFGGPVESTFYRRYGDVFGWSCVGLATLLGAMILVPLRREAKRDTSDVDNRFSAV